MEVTRWLVHHGESLLESVGIIGGLIFTGVALHRDSRARRIQNLLTLTQHHRELWRKAEESPELLRIFDRDRQVQTTPVTERERLFVRSLIMHLSAVFRAARLDEILRINGVEQDVRSFFSSPVPADVWRDVKRFQEDDFVRFVEKALRD